MHVCSEGFKGKSARPSAVAPMEEGRQICTRELLGRELGQVGWCSGKCPFV